MKKRGIFLGTIAIIFTLISTGCVSPSYGTARIEKGFHADAGVAVTSFSSPAGDWNYCIGLRGDCEIDYGFNKYFKVGGRVGGGGGFSIPIPGREEPTTSWSGPFPLIEGTLAVQGSYPFKQVTPALRIEAGSNFSIMPLVGFGDPEWLTLGCRIWFLYNAEVFVPDFFMTVRPSSRLSIFAGVNAVSIFSESLPIATLGIGYKLK
jgi:hypothetical protein